MPLHASRFLGTTAFNSQLRAHLDKELSASTCSISAQLAPKRSLLGESQHSNSRGVTGQDRGTVLEFCAYCFNFHPRFSK